METQNIPTKKSNSMQKTNESTPTMPNSAFDVQPTPIILDYTSDKLFKGYVYNTDNVSSKGFTQILYQQTFNPAPESIFSSSFLQNLSINNYNPILFYNSNTNRAIFLGYNNVNYCIL